MTAPEPQPLVSLEFLQNWGPAPWTLSAITSGNISTQTFGGPGFGDNDPADLLPWLERCATRQANVYFSVNRLLGRPTSKAAVTDVDVMHWLHVDVDPRAGEDLSAERKRIYTMLTAEIQGVPAPSCIVFSGGGYQAFWRLADPIDVHGTLALGEDAKRYNQQLETILDADGCHNIDRIMRLPGTINWPNDKKRKRGQQPVLSEVVHFDVEKTFELSQFMKSARVQELSDPYEGSEPVNISGNVRRDIDVMPDGDLPEAVAMRTRRAIVQGRCEEEPLSGSNGRSEWLWHVVCQLIRANVDDDTIYSIITDPSFKISESVLDKGSPNKIERYAKKQIRDAKAENADPLLAEMNGKYAFVANMNGKAAIVELSPNHTGSLSFKPRDIAGFRTSYSNRFGDRVDAKGNPKLVPLGDWWITHPKRRTYDAVVFKPEQDVPNCLNRWQGYRYDSVPGDCSLYLKHVMDNVCSGQQEHYDYLIQWMANAVQNPGTPGRVAVVLRGRQGTGKGVFAQVFGALFGKNVHFKHVTDINSILGQFNATVRDAVVLYADEVFTANGGGASAKKREAALKTLISEDQIQVREMYAEHAPHDNTMHLIISSNEDWILPVALDDRRIFALLVDDKERCDGAYFGAIMEQMEAGGYEALFHMLRSLPLDDFKITTHPKTPELRAQQVHSLSSVQQFVFDALESGQQLSKVGEWAPEMVNLALLAEFEGAVARKVGDRSATKRSVTMALRAIGVTVKRFRGSKVYVDERGMSATAHGGNLYVFPPLETARANWDEAFDTDTDWPTITADPPEEVAYETPRPF